MQPPDTVGRCRSCPLQAPLWEGLCLHDYLLRQRRLETREKLRALVGKGVSIEAIAAKLGKDQAVIRRAVGMKA